jgi:hypothetical protein
MAEGSLADNLDAALRQTAELAERHRAAQAHEANLARLEYVHGLARRLAEELAALRGEAERYDEMTGGEAGEELRRACLEALRAGEPPSLRAPAQALVTGEVELLQLVEYLGSAVATARGSRGALRCLPLASQWGA